MARLTSYVFDTSKSTNTGLPIMVVRTSVPIPEEPKIVDSYGDLLKKLRKHDVKTNSDDGPITPLLIAQLKNGTVVVFHANNMDSRYLISGDLRDYGALMWLHTWERKLVLENRLDIEVAIFNHNVRCQFTNEGECIARWDVI